VPGTVPQARIDDAARRILVAKCEMGLLDGTDRLVDRTLTARVGSAEHRALARRSVSASLVVLKNANATLPLSKSVAGLALGGKTGDNIGNQCGGWTVAWQGMTGAVTTGTTVRQAFEAVLPGKVSYALDGSMTTGAAVGVAVIGETPYSEGCGDIPTPVGGSSCYQRPTTLSLDAADVQVVQRMKDAGLPTVVVLVVGRPMIIDSIIDLADAIVASSATPRSARSTILSSSSRGTASPSAVPCTSTMPPRPVATTLRSTRAMLSSAYARSSASSPSTCPTLTAAT
jgi:beta-glucosidase